MTGGPIEEQFNLFTASHQHEAVSRSHCFVRGGKWTDQILGKKKTNSVFFLYLRPLNLAKFFFSLFESPNRFWWIFFPCVIDCTLATFYQIAFHIWKPPPCLFYRKPDISNLSNFFFQHFIYQLNALRCIGVDSRHKFWPHGSHYRFGIPLDDLFYKPMKIYWYNDSFNFAQLLSTSVMWLV